MPHFPFASQSCRSLSNCSCPITFAGSLSTDGISGTSQSTQQCRAILTKTHTYIHKHVHKHTHTHTHTHLLGIDGISDTARLTQTNHPIANYYMLYTNRHIVKCCLPRVERIELPCLNTSHCIARLIPLRPLSSSLHSSCRGILLSPQCNGSGLTVSIALR